MIAHVDMDAFYASVEVLDHPELAGRPVIVGQGKRGVVSAASYEARALGVHSAMPVFRARQLCPKAAFMPVRMRRYQQVSKKVMEVLRSFSPLVEPVSVDEAFLDMSGTGGLWGGPWRAGRAVKKTMREKTGLTCSVGMAPVRFLAKIASDRDKPDGLVVVDDLEAFLETVSLAEISGVGAKSRKKMAQMGLTRLLDIRSFGRERLVRFMGVNGEKLWELAHGVDPTPVSLSRKVKSISNETTLSHDISDLEEISSFLLALCQKVCRRARAKGLCGRTAMLKLKHADHRLITRSRSLAQPVDTAEDMFPVIKELLIAYGKTGPFRLVGVGLSGLGGWDQSQAPLLGGKAHMRGRELAKAEDDLVRRFGEKAIVRAGSLPALESKRGKGHNEK